jgi:surface protein
MSDNTRSEPSAPVVIPPVVVPNLVRTDGDRKFAVNKWCENPIEAEAIYGHISLWDVSAVTSMRFLFCNKRSFNEDLSRWNVSACTNMEGMFDNASSFKSDLSGWSTGNVEYMHAMFYRASSFLSDLSEWIVMERTNVDDMFDDCPCDDFRPIWEERRQVQKRKDECWERRLPWMVAIAPYIRGEVTDAPIQMVFDIDGLLEFITSFM